MLGRGILVVLVFAGLARAQAPEWVYFESKETGKGPVLRLEMADGAKKELPVASDTVMLSYIERFIGARHTRLAVDLADKNRVLMRFDLPDAGKVRKAELEMRMRPSATPPRGAFSIAVYAVKTPWNESWVRWPLQPDYDEEARRTIRLEPRGQMVRIPVTDLVNTWLAKKRANHGLMIRVHKSFPKGEKRGVQPDEAVVPLPKRTTNAATDWISIASREAGKGPRLVLEIEGGRQEEILASADTGVISYLADRKWGRLKFMAISLNDSNRVLLRFELPPKMAKVEKATLRLDTKPSPMNPPQKFEVALHRLTKAWKEIETDWLTQPAMAKEPLATLVVHPATRERTLSFDVTDLVNEKTGFENGWLLKVAKPLAKPEVKKVPRAQRAARQILLQNSLKWADSVDAALREAKERNRMVLALVDGTYDITKPSFGAELILATALADPDIRALIEKRFVSVRVAYMGQAYTTGRGTSPELRALGTTVAKTKAPALVVSDATGTHVATLESFGTYDKHTVLHLLVDALPPTKGGGDPYELLAAGDWMGAAHGLSRLETPKAKRAGARIMAFAGDHAAALKRLGPLTRGPEGAEARAQMGVALMRLGRFDEAERELTKALEEAKENAPEARYYLGCLLHKDRRYADARAQWQAIPASSTWSLPARLRLSMPDRIAMYETLAAVRLRPGKHQSTEVPIEGVEKAIAYLLAQQLPDGSWPIGDHQQESTRSAITALAAKALLVWDADKEAVKKAVAWIGAWMEKTNPEHANSFGAAYILDLQLERYARDKSAKEDVQKAVAYLFGGQAPNGAWSYDKRFAIRWRGGFGGWPRTDQGRVHSMNTGAALVLLALARDAGLEVSAADLERGREILLKMKQAPAAFTYTYPDPISWEKEEFNIGRAPVCEQALWMLDGKKDAADLGRSLENFMKWRHDLRGPVKLTPGWTMPRGVSSYFYFFAYYHAARAIESLGGPQAKERLQALRDDLLRVAEADGTWVDYPAIGKPYGTAMALLVLHMGK